MKYSRLSAPLIVIVLVLGGAGSIAVHADASQASERQSEPDHQESVGRAPGVAATESVERHPHFGAITGRVTNKYGQPLAGIEVEIRDVYFHATNRSTTTDAAGNYRFDELYSSFFTIFIEEPGYLQEAYDNKPCWFGCLSSAATPPTRVGVIDGETTSGIDFRLEQPARMYVVDVDPDFSRDFYFDHLGEVPPLAYVNYFWPGTYYALATHYDYGVSELYDGVPCPGYSGTIEPCDLSLGTPIHLESGEVRELSMPAQSGAGIYGRLTDADTGDSLYGSLEIWDASGRLVGVEARLSPGDYYAIGRADGSVTKLYPDLPCPMGPPHGCDPTSGGKIRVADEHLQISMALEAGGAISASIFGPGHTGPIGDYTVEVFDANGRTVAIDDEGHHEHTFDGLPPGSYVLAAYFRGEYSSFEGLQGEFNDGRLCHRHLENGCNPAGSSPVTVQAGQTTEVEFSLSPFGTVTGAWNPLLGKVVRAWNLEGEAVETPIQIDLESFSFRHLPPGQYRFSTETNRYSPDDKAIDQLYPGIQCPGGPGIGCDLESGEIVSFGPGEVRSGVDFDLDPGGSLYGTVMVRSTGAPPVGAKVYAFDSAGQELGWTWADDEGAFTLAGLASGTYTLRTTSSNPALLTNVLGGGPCGDCDAIDGTLHTVTTGQATGPVAIELDSKVSWCSRPGNACLLENRFLVEGSMSTFDVPPRVFETRAMAFASGRAESNQAVFFESFSAGNFELGVKMVDGCSLPGNDPRRAYWVFVGGLTNARSVISIEDTVSGELLTWENPRGEFPLTYANTRAFSCTDGTPDCSRTTEAACLLDGRFRVTGVMEDFATPPSSFPARVMSFPQAKAVSRQAAFFESFSPGNFEVGVKMVDGCDLPFGHPQRGYWIFYGGLSNAATTLRVTQLETDVTNVWQIEPGQLPLSVGRINAFECE